jgi:hypothetical protein
VIKTDEPLAVGTDNFVKRQRMVEPADSLVCDRQVLATAEGVGSLRAAHPQHVAQKGFVVGLGAGRVPGLQPGERPGGRHQHD